MRETLLVIKFPVDSEYWMMNGKYIGGNGRDQFEGTVTHFTWRDSMMLLKASQESWPSIQDSNPRSPKYR
jgi:hypothetical protein